MNKILKLSVLLITFSIQSQIVTIDSDVNCTREIPNAYYNDTNNYLDPYIGTWQYLNGNELFIIKLRKVYSVNNLNSEDMLIGEYQYIDSNGIEKINTLAKFNLNNNQYFHTIIGNCIYDHSYYIGGKNFSDCISSIKIVGLTHSYENNIENNYCSGSIYMAIITQGTLTQLKLWIQSDLRKYEFETDTDDEEYVKITDSNSSLIPMGYYTLTKQ